MGSRMSVNQPLLDKIREKVDRHFEVLFKRILTASAEYGVFGISLLEKLHNELPRTECENCGRCCNAISIFSIEYHHVIRELMARKDPGDLRRKIQTALRFEPRMAEVEGEFRLRCAFRDDENRVCRIHPFRPFACRLFGLRHDDGTRECEKVREMNPGSSITDSAREALQARILDIAESHEVEPGRAIGFFPLEFWLFRFALGPGAALEIYREILVPASTPLTRFWRKS